MYIIKNGTIRYDNIRNEEFTLRLISQFTGNTRCQYTCILKTTNYNCTILTTTELNSKIYTTEDKKAVRTENPFITHD